MYCISARLRITTPLFAGGADPKQRVEVRVPAIKGMLRFWWRALAWSRHDGDLQWVQQEEAARFGSTDYASPIRMSLDTSELSRQTLRGYVHQEFKELDGARYLGYGLMQAYPNEKRTWVAGQLWRPCIEAGGAFTLRLISPQPVPDDVIEAIKVWGLLGGLGSRVRRGYGSLSLEAIRGDGIIEWSAPTTVEDYERELESLLSDARQGQAEPPYTAFSGWTRIDRLATGVDALRLLDEVGCNMVRYRSWGRKGSLPWGEEAERNFPEDHDWCKGNVSEMHPRRAVFGLPHNYYQQKNQRVAPKNHDRRASPLFIHIHRLGNGEHVAIGAILRSRFLPEGERIKAGNETVTPKPEWEDVLEAFFEGLKGPRDNKTDEAYFPNRRRLL